MKYLEKINIYIYINKNTILINEELRASIII